MRVVAALRVAPVKGLATVTTQRVELGPEGAAGDRQLFLLDDAGAVVTLRSHPELVQVVPDLDVATGVLTVRLPNGQAASSRLDDTGADVSSSLFGKERPGRVLGGDVGPALSAVAEEAIRVIATEQAGVGWDEGPVSIIGRSSIAAVGGPDADGARYRMMVELAGTEPYEEDGWVASEVVLGEARVRVTQTLGRCVVVTRSPVTGEKDWDGLAALARERGPGRLCLGVIAEVVQPGAVTVGSAVEVLA